MKRGSQSTKRLLSFIMAFAMVLTMLPLSIFAADTGTTVYLVPNANWKQANARFAVYCFGNGETWVSMTDADGDGMYEAVVPDGYSSIIFCRMNPSAAANNWDNKWNQTGDLTLPGDGANCYTVAEGNWDGSGTWSIYAPPVAEPDKANVKGTIPGLDWDAASETGAMTLGGDGIYTLTIPSVPASEVGADAYAFKVMVNNSWDTAYPDGNWTFYLSKTCDVTITYNPDGNKVDIQADGLTYDAPVAPVANVKGTIPGLDWDAASETGAMTLGDDGIYTLTIADVPASEVGADAYAFKVMVNNSWDTAYPDGNWTFYLSKTCDVTITYNPDGNKVDIQADGLTYDKPAGDSTAAPGTTYVVAGTGLLCGAEWDPSALSNAMKLNAETGLYEKTFEGVRPGTHSFKVTDGTWANAWGNGGDDDGNTVFMLENVDNKFYNVTVTFNAESKEIAVSSELTDATFEVVNNVTLYYRNTGMWNTVNAYGWYTGTENALLGAWPGTTIAEYQGETDDTTVYTNWYKVELKDLNAANGIGLLFNNGNNNQTGDIMITADGTYWYDNGSLTQAASTENWPDGSVDTVSYEVTLHFANSYNWGGVNLYAWTAMGDTPNGSWPGSSAGLDSDGFYSATLTYEAPEGQGLNFIFSGSGQTVDLALSASDFVDNKAEKWVVPTVTNDEGKYYADIVSDPDAIAISPVVDGQNITFEYKNAGAASVAVFGTMGMKAGDSKWIGYNMTKNEHGVWSVTLEDVAYGLYSYKFVVDGNWITDPINSWMVTDDNGNTNSAVLISDPSNDNNIVDINIHYDAPSSEWNVCAWGAPGLASQYNFTDGVTTITLNGRASQYVCFKVRKSVKGNDWAEQSGEIRVDLANIVSGTIDVYVDGSFNVTQKLNPDVVTANKVTSVELDYDNNTVTIKTTKTVSNPASAFTIPNADGFNIIQSVAANGSAYTLTLTEELDLVTLYKYAVLFNEDAYAVENDLTQAIGINTVYASKKFETNYWYQGGDLGANWTKNSTTFVLWAPTAEDVGLNLYVSGTEGEVNTGDATHQMTKGDKGIWTVTVNGDLNGVYYTYDVMVNGKVEEDVVDPYARTAGVNGKRGMVIDLDSTDPEGWDEDCNPNPITSYTDAIIYELHVRDFSNDDSSGVKDEWQGKYMAFTQEGTTTENGTSTGIDYLKDMGFTHLHLLPVYDYGSVDETTCDTFNWGYDPVNYNVPEGSYSTEPENGKVRVNEFKQMVKALHDADISVIMDVVYNHVYDAGKFSMNRIVPNYFSRTNPDGSFSNGSGCGNDTASEREMVRKFIVESIMYWKEEYHIDGFRFDLVGLLDETTINEIVKTVHDKYPDVIFYGEGWTLGTAVEPGNDMATQANASGTPDFAYFSDTIRNLLAGSNGSSLGFVSGLTGQEEAIRDNFMARPWWTSKPTQIVQYASCHDNYTLIDKLVISTDKDGIDDDIIKMNNLAAAIYMTSQGIPFIHAGEEFLREKLDPNSHTGRCENSYNASDAVNNIDWTKLTQYAANSDYYKGLIEFRKAHEALRMDSTDAITQNIDYTWIDHEVVMFTIDGKAAGDISDSIVVIFNASGSSETVKLPEGEWEICVDYDQAGTQSQETVTDGDVEVAGISAMVLVQGATEEPAITYAGSTLKYEDQIKVVNLFNLAGLDGVDLTTDAGVMVFTKAQYDAWDKASVAEANAKPGLKLDTATGCYYAESNPILIDDLHLEHYYVGYVKLEDNTYIFSEKTLYSPAIYAYNMLEADSGANENTRKLCVALLNYISAFQKYRRGTTGDALANAGLTDEQKAQNWADVKTNSAGSTGMGDRHEVFTNVGRNLQFGYNVSLMALFKVADDAVNSAEEAYTIFWTEMPGEDLSGGTRVDLYRQKAGQWASVAPATAAKDIEETTIYYMACLKYSDGTIKSTEVLAYTIEQYIECKRTNTNAFAEMCKALYFYERAANVVFG